MKKLNSLAVATLLATTTIFNGSLFARSLSISGNIAVGVASGAVYDAIKHGAGKVKEAAGKVKEAIDKCREKSREIHRERHDREQHELQEKWNRRGRV